jgi:alkylhydroperoxidase/carboxymuconolactone decarboxylase family protein YurZ
LDYTEVLRRLAISDERFVGECRSGAARVQLDPKTLALVRLGALVAVGGAVPSYGAETDAAVGAGASATEIVEVLIGVVSVVGLPSVVAAAPNLAMALGYDVDDALAAHSASDLGYSPSRPTTVACSTASLREETPSFR